VLEIKNKTHCHRGREIFKTEEKRINLGVWRERERFLGNRAVGLSYLTKEDRVPLDLEWVTPKKKTWNGSTRLD